MKYRIDIFSRSGSEDFAEFTCFKAIRVITIKRGKTRSPGVRNNGFEIEKQLSETTPSVHYAFLRYLRAAFNFGIRRAWCGENPVKRIEVDAQQKLNQQHRKKEPL